mmetsp:Transcript_124771/g.216368  ORF Transcript_124771/g.216368 Transcript_124771/m.216368 type:complete len:101 (-) Transcript_124771:21-323(-)
MAPKAKRAVKKNPAVMKKPATSSAQGSPSAFDGTCFQEDQREATGTVNNGILKITKKKFPKITFTTSGNNCTAIIYGKEIRGHLEDDRIFWDGDISWHRK